MPNEVEIKLEVPPASLPRLKSLGLLRKLTSLPTRAKEVSVYFDTRKHTLRSRGLMLRVRRTGDRHVQTIKASGNSGLFERGEWESDIKGEKPDLGLARGTALEPLIGKNFSRRLRPMFETRVKRTVYPLAAGTSAIELALDNGTIDTGDRSARLCEIELELKQGNEEELFKVARKITEELPARLAFKSKSARGYDLLDDRENEAIQAAPVDFEPGAIARDGFRAIGAACLKQIVSNEAALLKGDPEGVHQMRVGLRRMRAATSLFADIIRDDAQTAKIKSQLKWLTEELGPARELQVLLKRVVAPLNKRHKEEGVPALSQELEKERKDAIGRARTAVESPMFRAMTLEIAAWLEAGKWRNPQDELVRDRGAVPLEDFAGEQLGLRWKKVLKKGRALARLDAKSRHKLRIQAKKVRYAAEFFADLFSNKRASKRRENGHSNACKMPLAISTTSWCTRNASQQRAFGAVGPAASEHLPPACSRDMKKRVWKR
jgi:triphosphatase